MNRPIWSHCSLPSATLLISMGSIQLTCYTCKSNDFYKNHFGNTFFTSSILDVNNINLYSCIKLGLRKMIIFIKKYFRLTWSKN